MNADLTVSFYGVLAAFLCSLTLFIIVRISPRSLLNFARFLSFSLLLIPVNYCPQIPHAQRVVVSAVQLSTCYLCISTRFSETNVQNKKQQESPANAKGTRDSSACMKGLKAHCEQM